MFSNPMEWKVLCCLYRWRIESLERLSSQSSDMQLLSGRTGIWAHKACALILNCHLPETALSDHIHVFTELWKKSHGVRIIALNFQIRKQSSTPLCDFSMVTQSGEGRQQEEKALFWFWSFSDILLYYLPSYLKKNLRN